MQSMLLEHSKPSAAALVGGSPRLRIAEAHDVQATDVDEGARRRQGGCRGAGSAPCGAHQRRNARRRTSKQRGERGGVLRVGRAERGSDDAKKLASVADKAAVCETVSGTRR